MNINASENISATTGDHFITTCPFLPSFYLIWFTALAAFYLNFGFLRVIRNTKLLHPNLRVMFLNYLASKLVYITYVGLKAGYGICITIFGVSTKLFRIHPLSCLFWESFWAISNAANILTCCGACIERIWAHLHQHSYHKSTAISGGTAVAVIAWGLPIVGRIG